jgi:hypothetical protein
MTILRTGLHAILHRWHLLEGGCQLLVDKTQHHTSSRQEHRDMKGGSKFVDGDHRPMENMGSGWGHDDIPLSELIAPRLLEGRLHLDTYSVGIEVSTRYAISLNS